MRPYHVAVATTLYAHLTWTTLRRAPLIDAAIADLLGRFLPAQAGRFGVEVIAVGLVQDHVHLLLQLPVSCPIAQLVQQLKGASARVANRDGVAPPDLPLRWERGYDLRSVSPRALSSAADYVRRQGQRHPLRRIPRASDSRHPEVGP
jgi:REP element-mobilizing transposase RayT